MKFSNLAINALRKKYESEKEVAIANLYAYLQNDPVGIGEHPDLIDAVESQLKLISNAQDMLEALDIAENSYNTKVL